MKVWAIFYRVPFFTDYRLHGESERDMPTRSIKNNVRKLRRSRAACCSTTLRRPSSRFVFLMTGYARFVCYFGAVTVPLLSSWAHGPVHNSNSTIFENVFVVLNCCLSAK